MFKMAAIAALGTLVAQASLVPLSASLTGQAEPGRAGALGESGNATITLNVSTGQVCYDLSARNLPNITAAHIHRGEQGQSGPPVVGLPVKPTPKGCVDSDPVTVKAIAQNPSAYYVNIHTTQFPEGAIRGQLGRSR